MNTWSNVYHVYLVGVCTAGWFIWSRWLCMYVYVYQQKQLISHRLKLLLQLLFYVSKMICNECYSSCISYTCMYLSSFIPRLWLYNLIVLYKLHTHLRNELSQVHSMICSTKKWKRIYQPIVFSKGYPDVLVLNLSSLRVQCNHQNLHMHSQSVPGHQNS